MKKRPALAALLLIGCLLAGGMVRLDGEICKTGQSAGSGNFLISPAAS